MENPQLGDRVRVKLDSNCQKKFTLTGLWSGKIIRREISHPPETDGLIGTITNPDNMISHPDHPYYVEFDTPLEVSAAGTLSGAVYSAEELERIDDGQSD